MITASRQKGLRVRSQRFFREVLGGMRSSWCIASLRLNDVRLDGADTTESRQRLPAALNYRLRTQAGPARDLIPASAWLLAKSPGVCDLHLGIYRSSEGGDGEAPSGGQSLPGTGEQFSMMTDSLVLQLASACFNASISKIVMALGHGWAP